MVKIFTFVNVEAGRAKDVHRELKKIARKINADVYGLFGEYDFLVITDAGTLKTAANRVVKDVQGIDGVWTTRTLVEAEFD